MCKRNKYGFKSGLRDSSMSEIEELCCMGLPIPIWGALIFICHALVSQTSSGQVETFTNMCP